MCIERVTASCQRQRLLSKGGSTRFILTCGSYSRKARQAASNGTIQGYCIILWKKQVSIGWRLGSNSFHSMGWRKRACLNGTLRCNVWLWRSCRVWPQTGRCIAPPVSPVCSRKSALFRAQQTNRRWRQRAYKDRCGNTALPWDERRSQWRSRCAGSNRDIPSERRATVGQSCPSMMIGWNSSENKTQPQELLNSH